MLHYCTIRIEDEPNEFISGIYEDAIQDVFNKYLNPKPNGYFDWEFNWDIPGHYSISDAIYFCSALSELNILTKITTWSVDPDEIPEFTEKKSGLQKTDKEFLLQYLEDVYTLEKDLYCAYNGQATAISNAIDLAICPINERRLNSPQPQKQSFFSKLLGGHNSQVSPIETKEFEKRKSKLPSCLETIDAFEESIVPSEMFLQSLYNMNVLFPKYRNLIAVSQIYEYIASGRCTELEGPNGAYNLYESELRQNNIISKLDVIINQLELIQQTQSMLYSAIQQSNRLLENISQNTAIIAFNSQITADNSEIVKRYYINDTKYN